VVGDWAGFVAATWMRGVPFIQVPTTLLAMVDSSVGGKTGVNHPKAKNLIGAFHQPSSVTIDPQCLATLPERELKAGLAEVIKYGVIADDKFFAWLEANIEAALRLDMDALETIIARSCELKAEVVGDDERPFRGARSPAFVGAAPHELGRPQRVAPGRAIAAAAGCFGERGRPGVVEGEARVPLFGERPSDLLGRVHVGRLTGEGYPPPVSPLRAATDRLSTRGRGAAGTWWPRRTGWPTAT
jgi:hypothetical protein